MTNWDVALSKKVADLIGAQKNRCWYNSISAMKHLPALFFSACYVEGWLVLTGRQEIEVIEHGWIEQNGGQIVDPSLILRQDANNDKAYFPGLCYDWFEVQEVPPHLLLPLARLAPAYEGARGPVAYQRAYQAAVAHAEHLSQTLEKPVQVYTRLRAATVTTPEGNILITFQD